MSPAYSTPPHRVAYGFDCAEGRLLITRSARGRHGVRTRVLLDTEAASQTPGPAEGLAQVRRDCARNRAAGVAALPTPAGFVRWLRTPFPSRRKAEKVFPSLLDLQLPFPIEECLYTFLETRGTETAQVESLAVAGRKSDVEAVLSKLAAHHLDPEVLDHEALALWRQSVEELPVEAQTTRMLVFLGQDHTAFILGHGDRLLSAHGLRAGLDRILPPAGTEPDASHQQARVRLVRRAQQLVQAQGAQHPPGGWQWVWTGPGAEDRGLLEALQRDLALPDTPFAVHREPRTFLARALSEGAVRPSRLRVNLRLREWAHAGQRRRLGRRRTATALLAAAAGLLVAAVSLSWGALLDRRQAQLQQRVTQLAAELTGSSRVPRGQEVEVVRRAVSARKQDLAPFLQAFQPPLLERVGAILDIAAGAGLQLDALTLREDFVGIRGTSVDWDGCKPLERALEQEGYELNTDLRDAGADELVHFSMQGKRNP